MDEPWVMPEWMEPYRDLIVNTGGNPIEELMSDRDTNAVNNVIRAALIVPRVSPCTASRWKRTNPFP